MHGNETDKVAKAHSSACTGIGNQTHAATKMLSTQYQIVLKILSYLDFAASLRGWVRRAVTKFDG